MRVQGVPCGCVPGAAAAVLLNWAPGDPSSSPWPKCLQAAKCDFPPPANWGSC